MSSFYDLLEDVDGKLRKHVLNAHELICPDLLERLDFDWKYPADDDKERTDCQLKFEAEPAKHIVSIQCVLL